MISSSSLKSIAWTSGACLTLIMFCFLQANAKQTLKKTSHVSTRPIVMEIQHMDSGKCLDVVENRELNLVIFDCLQSDSQLWSILEGNKIRSILHRNLCINCTPNIIHLGACDYKSTMETFKTNGSRMASSFQMNFKGTRLCVNNDSNLKNNLNRINAQDCDNNSGAQKFRFVPVETHDEQQIL